MRILAPFILLVALAAGCDESASLTATQTDSQSSSAAFDRAQSVIAVFIKDDIEAKLSKTHEYENASGGTTIKGNCRVEGQNYYWVMTMDRDLSIKMFAIDQVSFLATQENGLALLPENAKYIENDFIKVPSVEEIRAIGVAVDQVGF